MTDKESSKKKKLPWPESVYTALWSDGMGALDFE